MLNARSKQFCQEKKRFRVGYPVTWTNQPARTVGPQAVLKSVSGWSQVGNKNNRIIQFGFGFTEISPK